MFEERPSPYSQSKFKMGVLVVSYTLKQSVLKFTTDELRTNLFEVIITIDGHKLVRNTRCTTICEPFITEEIGNVIGKLRP